MSTHHRRFAALLSVALGIAACGVLQAADVGAAAYTVGDLAIRLAHDLRVEVSAEGADVASAALVSAGITISGDLTRPLREKDLIDVLNQLGLHLSTSKPDRTVDEVRLGRLLDLVLATPATEGENGVSSSDRGNNPPGGGFGRSKSHASPHDR
jgi:hypothetical protein